MTVVVPAIFVVPFGFLVAAYIYNRISPQKLQLSSIISGMIMSLMQFIIIFYLVGLVFIFVRMLSGASVEELSTVNDNILCANTVLAYSATLLLAFRFAAKGPRTTDATVVASRSTAHWMRNVIIAMIVILILTTALFLIMTFWSDLFGAR